MTLAGRQIELSRIIGERNPRKTTHKDGGCESREEMVVREEVMGEGDKWEQWNKGDMTAEGRAVL